MASKIRVLNEHTINKIAAGEVIENPSSVVKELVENSIDAGATDIGIEIRGGGRQMIRIDDNGSGMNKDDALLCLERHATSKLRDDSDMHALMTMGFRGEAIPSIASISKFNLLTCPKDEEKATGTMVIVDGGKLISASPAARSPGTTMEVKSLFFNVPVRKKFLKSPAFDTNEILKMVSLIALGHPNIKFQLINDGKTILTTDPVPDSNFQDQLNTRIKSVLGDDFVENTMFIDEASEEISIQGVIGLPGYTRHNRTGQYLFINKRGVVSPLISFAVKDGFSTSIDSSRFPVFVLHLSVNGDLVDVNVHPQKREVRLRQEQTIRELIVKAIRKALSQRQNTPKDPFENRASPVSPVFAHALGIKESLNQKESGSPWELRPYQTWSEVASTITYPLPQINEKPKEYTSIPLPLPPTTLTPPRVIATVPRYFIIDETTSKAFVEQGGRSLEKGGIFLIDQKNAHARILFEKLSHQHPETQLVQQMLLVPHTIELSPHESEGLRLCLPHLNTMGIHIQEFGENAFMLDALPQIFGSMDGEKLIRDIINNAHLVNENTGDGASIKKENMKRIALAASRAAISGDKRLSIPEGQSIMNQLALCEHPFHCPSGKPILVQITGEELAKLFLK
ncbi:MAG: DNA mismatch repair endonuclease MutL [Parachlamydiaceae bacterium]